MDKPPDAEPAWLGRIQRAMAALAALSGEAAKVADSLRRIFR